MSVPFGFRSSAVRRSVIVAEIGLPGKNFAPPEATKIEPLNGWAPPVKSTREVLDADPQVGELEDAAEADSAGRTGGRGELVVAGGGRVRAAVAQLGRAEREAGVAHGQARVLPLTG